VERGEQAMKKRLSALIAIGVAALTAFTLL
jgi:hypothetical protein